MKYAIKNIAACSNGKAAVCAVKFSDGSFSVYSYAPKSIGKVSNKIEFERLFKLAVDKL